MKIKVFDKAAKKVEQPVLLRLSQNANSVTLLAVNEYGVREHCGSLLIIDAKGVRLCGAVSANIGFPLYKGRLQVNE